MKWPAETLWDLLGLAPRPAPRSAGRGAAARRPGGPAQRRYDALVAEMKQAYGLRVRRWRRSTSGCAWAVHYRDGSLTRFIESPYPRGPVSCAVFLHEVGHHAIGLERYRLRCLEEYHAWMWALRQMRTRGLTVTSAVERRVAESLRYAVAKARQRGIRGLPAELRPWDSGPPAAGG